MKVLITGVNGFIGGKLAEKCIQENLEVFGVDLADFARNNGINEYRRCDMVVDDLTEMLAHFAPDVIVHCAGSADVAFSVQNPQEDFKRNVVATHNLLWAMWKAGMQHVHLIMMSSAGVYGNPQRLPICESDPTNPISPYALHKKMIEDISVYFTEKYYFDISILRVFSAYGPGLKKQLFWDMYRKIKNTGKLELFGTGQESRDYIYIDDLIRVLGKMIHAPRSGELIYNVANGEEIRIADAARMFVDAMGLPQDIISFNNMVREGDPLNWRADIEKLTALGYQPKVEMQEGIQRYVAWCREQKI